MRLLPECVDTRILSIVLQLDLVKALLVLRALASDL